MKPVELRVYDHYPEIVVHLWRLANQIASLPLDDLNIAHQKVTLTGNHRSPGGVITPVPAEAAAAQQQLIDAAIAFRTALAADDPEPAPTPAPAPLERQPAPPTAVGPARATT